MKPGARFNNPMLGSLRGRRFTRRTGAGRVESRAASGGKHRAYQSGSIQAHRHFVLNRFTAAPVYRIGIARTSNSSIAGGRDRIETRIVREHGPIREVLRVDRSDGEFADPQLVSSRAVATIRDLAESTVERVMRRRQRIETRRESSLVMRDRQSTQVDVERVLRSSAAVRAATPEADKWLPAGVPTAAAHTQPFPDLDRLTDQIVSRIDDRLIAHRERMGTVY